MYTERASQQEALRLHVCVAAKTRYMWVYVYLGAETLPYTAPSLEEE